MTEQTITIKESNNTSITSNDKPTLQQLCKEAIESVTIAIATAEKSQMTNYQFFMDFEDELNKLSVKDHSI